LFERRHEFAKENTMLSIGTILHPTDFSQHSESAFQLACALAWDYKARLVLLHVTTIPAVIYAGGVVPPDPWPGIEEAQAKLRELESQAPGVRVESQVMEGDPVDMILRAAKETNSDVIIMGTHGRTALARLLLGSVAEGVIRKAPCPVLTAKPTRVRKKAVEPTVPTEAGLSV
jgi:nucleotide-binding universal stress UspA family protein